MPIDNGIIIVVTVILCMPFLFLIILLSKMNLQKEVQELINVENILEKTKLGVVICGHYFGYFINTNKKGIPLIARNTFVFGEPCRNRTDNLMIKSHLLCQLS